jgi:hypothetical protein
MHGFHQTYYRLRNYFGRTRWYSYVTWAMWNLISFRLEMVLVSVQDRCTVCANHTIGLEIILKAPDGAPRSVAQLEARFGRFRDSANLDARSVHGLRRTYHRLRNHFGCTR